MKKVMMFFGILIATQMSLAQLPVIKSNMMISMLECTMTADSIAKLTAAKSNTSASFVLLADYAAISRLDVPAMIAYSQKQVGAVSPNQILTGNSAGGSLGTFYGSRTDENGFKSGVIFKSETVVYNYKYSWNTIVTLQVVGKQITATVVDQSLQADGVNLTYNYTCADAPRN